jgi:DNA-binding transcriptional ArsR family regulator
MDGDKITLDRETFKALAVDSRVKILRLLDDRQHTLTDLSEELGMAPSTIKEHLDTLVSAGLITQIDKGMKWKYYRLTSKGKEIINPYEKKVLILLATSLLAAMASMYVLVSRLQNLIPSPFTPLARDSFNSLAAEGTQEAMDEAGPMLTKSIVENETGRGLTTAATQAPEAMRNLAQTLPQIPYFEIGMLVACALIVGVCIGFLIRKKKAI